MIPQPRPELVLIAGLSAPLAAPATEDEEQRRDEFERGNPDSTICTWEGCWVGNVRVLSSEDGRRGECTAVRDTLGEVLDVLSAWLAELAEPGP